MELLIGAGGGALLLGALVALANRRRRGVRHEAAPRSPGVPAHGSPGTNSWPLGGGSA